MASLLGAIFGDVSMPKDSVIANDMLAGAKAGAAAYLAASLESATPEVRRLFSQYSAQIAQGHEALTELAVKKGWYKPYDAPADQLQETFHQSQGVLGQASQ
jgi:spore coat protein CotF